VAPAKRESRGGEPRIAASERLPEQDEPE